ncbi:MAG: mechanosensitive ion channel family protein [Thiogranum sp.]
MNAARPQLPVLSRFLLLVTLLSASPLWADRPYPLEPVDTSSPRATLDTFRTNINGVWTIFGGEYWESPSYKLLSQAMVPALRALKTLDLSQTSPTTRIEVGYDAATYLFEVLARIPLPTDEDIPDASAFTAVDGPASWTIPHTEITIARITEGPREGEFLFTPETINRAEEFYLKTRHLPYREPVPLEHTAELREYLPGWMIPIAAVKRLPDWMLNVAFSQAIWKWCAFALLLLAIFGLLFAVRRFTGRVHSEKPVYYHLRQLILPVVIIILMNPTAYLLTEQINFIGTVAKSVNLVTGVIAYLMATWAVWVGSLLLAELAILSPKVSENSLDAQLLRLSARIIGIVLGIVLVFYGANQIGIPLVGVLAGVGVGGLAIALAAQDSLKNLLGSLMIFMDQPYKPGERIIVEGHDGFVEQIGLRSTKIRMLEGALTSIPNERMASLDIENIGRRKFIRRQTNLRLAYDTQPDKIETALAIINDVLKDHEGMQPELPPRVFFDEFNTDSLNLLVSYWYHPPRRWKALAYDQQVNLEILRRFDSQGIRLAPPTSTTRLVQDSAPLSAPKGI